MAASSVIMVSPFDPDYGARISLNGKEVKRGDTRIQMMDALMDEAESLDEEDFVIVINFSDTERGRACYQGKKETIVFTSDASKEDFEDLEKEIRRQRGEN